MKKLFDYDSPLMVWLRRFFNLVLLNMLWAVCCLPAVTAGASTAALYRIIASLSKDKEKKTEDTLVIHDFFAAFRSEFKQATILLLIQAAAAGLCIFDIYAATRFTLAVPNIVKYIAFVPSVCFLLISGYIYPLEAKFTNTVKEILRNAFYMSISHLHVSISVAFLNLVPFLFMYYDPDLFVKTSLFWAVFGVSLIALLNWMMLNRVFRKYAGEDNDQELSEQE